MNLTTKTSSMVLIIITDGLGVITWMTQTSVTG